MDHVGRFGVAVKVLLSAGLVGTRPLDAAGLLAGWSFCGDDVGLGLAEPCSLLPASPPEAVARHMVGMCKQ